MTIRLVIALTVIMFAKSGSIFAQVETLPLDKDGSPSSGKQATTAPSPTENGVLDPNLTCTAQETSVRAGEPVRLRITSVGAEKLEWKTTAGQLKIEGNETSVDTHGLTPGDYSVTITGVGKGKTATCVVKFRVYHPYSAIYR